MSSEYEKKLARAILQAVAIHEKSWVDGEQSGVGSYSVSEDEAFRLGFLAEGLPDELSYPFYLATHWRGDLVNWALDTLENKPTIYEDGNTPSEHTLEYLQGMVQKLGIAVDKEYSVAKFYEQFPESKEQRDKYEQELKVQNF